MYKRFELHNHTTQSDAAITCEELIEIMTAEKTDVFALTDHNTVSGHRIVREKLKERENAPQCLYGMEYTTYYGHILCPILNRYVPWDSIDRNHADLLIEACHAAGAIAGIAHPMAYGDPIAQGCRFEMTVRDFSCVDFIEIINNAQPMHEVNAGSMRWWEELCLKGFRIAATAGMDLHRRRDFGGTYATYIEGEAGGDPAGELTGAVRSGQTWVSNGLLLAARRTVDGVFCRIADVGKPRFERNGALFVTLRSENACRTYAMTGETLTIPENLLPPGRILIPKLYQKEPVLDHLVCVPPVIRLDDAI